MSKRVLRYVVKVDFETLELFVRGRKFSLSFLKRNEDLKKYIIVESEKEGLEIGTALLIEHAKKLKDLLALLKNPENVRFVAVTKPQTPSFKIDISKQA